MIWCTFLSSVADAVVVHAVFLIVEVSADNTDYFIIIFSFAFDAVLAGGVHGGRGRSVQLAMWRLSQK